MSLENAYLLIYTLLWSFTLLIYQYKVKRINLGSIIILFYLGLSVASISLYNDEFYNQGDVKLRIFPFLYLFFTIYMCIRPILKYSNAEFIEIQNPSKIFIYSISLIIIITGLLSLPTAISDFKTGLLQIVVDSSVGAELYREGVQRASTVGSGISNLSRIIFNAFSEIGLLLLLYLLTLKNKSKLIILGLVMSFLISFILPISRGQRTEPVLTIFSIFVTYFLLKDFMPDSLRKKITKIGVGFILVLIIPIVAITNSRFEETSKGSFYYVKSYVGQANINFNKFGLDAGGIRYGDRTAPLIKKFLLFDNVPNNYIESRVKHGDMKMNDSIFYTFLGDFTLDYGPYVGFFILLVLSFLFSFHLRPRSNILLFHQLILVYFLTNICVKGAMYLFSYGDIGGNIKMITLLLIYLYARFDYYAKTSKNNSTVSATIPSNTRE